MTTETKNKVIFALKIIAAIAAAVLGVLGAGSVLTSCKTTTSFSISADSLNVTNPNIQYVDSTSVSNPFWQ